MIENKERSKNAKMYTSVAISDEFMECQRRVEEEKLTKEKDKFDKAQKRGEKLKHQQAKKRLFNPE